MKDKPAAASTPELPGDRAPNASHPRRIAILGGVCLLAIVASAPVLLSLHGNRSERMPAPGDYAKAASDEFTAEAIAELLPGAANPMTVEWLSGPRLADSGEVEYTLQLGSLPWVDDAGRAVARRAAAEVLDENLIETFFAADGALAADSAQNTAGGYSVFLAGGPDSSANDDATPAGTMNGSAHPPMQVASAGYSVVPEMSGSSAPGASGGDDRKRIPALRMAKPAAATSSPEREMPVTAANPPGLSGAGIDELASMGTSSRSANDGLQGSTDGAPDSTIAGATIAFETATGPRHVQESIASGTGSTLNDHGAAPVSGANVVAVENVVLVATTASDLQPVNPNAGPQQAVQQVGPLQVAPLPEPGMLALLGLGLAGIGWSRRKRQHLAK